MLFFLFSGFYLNQDQSVTVSEPQFKVIPITYVSNELEPNHIRHSHNHKDHKEHKRHDGILITYEDPREGRRRSSTRVN